MTIMIVVFIVVLVLGVIAILVYMDNLERRKTAALFYQFSKLGSRYGLSFTSQEMLARRIIGFDAIIQKIVVFEILDDSFDWYLINLKEVKRCAVKKIYGSIDAGKLNKVKMEEYLEVIVLEFYFKDDQRTVSLPFYIKLQNTPEEIPVLDQKARDWEAMLGKMISGEVKRA